MSSPDSRRNSRNSRFGADQKSLYPKTPNAFLIRSRYVQENFGECGCWFSDRPCAPVATAMERDRFFMHLFNLRTREHVTADNRWDLAWSGPEINWHFNPAIRICATGRSFIFPLPADLARVAPINLFRRAADSSERASRLIVPTPLPPVLHPWL